MIGVLVDHDLIASPVPVRDDVVIERTDVPVETAKPEALPVSASKRECTSKTAAEMSVGPRLSEVVMRIVGAAIMSDPLVILGVNVRNIRMTLLVHGNVVLRRGIMLLTSRRIGSPRGGRTVSGDMSTANRRRVPGA
jgi:hypothetical protein